MIKVLFSLLYDSNLMNILGTGSDQSDRPNWKRSVKLVDFNNLLLWLARFWALFLKFLIILHIVNWKNILKVYRPERTHSRNRYTFDARQPSRPRSRVSLGQSHLGLSSSRDKSTRRRQPKIKSGQVHIWVKKTEDKCNCPKLRVRRTYLMMGKHKRISQRVVDQAISNGARIDR